MAAGAPILARDTDYNREVLGCAGEFVSDDPELIAKSVLHLMGNRAEREDESRAMMLRAAQHYSWESVARSYDSAMRAVMEARGVSAHAEVHPILSRAVKLDLPVPRRAGPQRIAM